MKSKTVNRRRLLIRLVLAVIWISLGVLLFVKNRGHTVLLDNKNIDTPQITAPGMIRVKVDKKNEMEFFRGDRDLVKVAGSRHKIRVEFSDGSAPFDAQFSLPLGPDMFLLSIPKMLNGIEPYIEVFHTQPESRNAEEDAAQE
jgi:hypothetical protein